MTALDTSGKVIQGWDPEDSDHWDSKIAWRTLWISTFVLIIGFATWYLVSAIAPQLNQIGFDCGTHAVGVPLSTPPGRS